MIERIIIKNFKGIKEADISFHDKIQKSRVYCFLLEYIWM